MDGTPRSSTGGARGGRPPYDVLAREPHPSRLLAEVIARGAAKVLALGWHVSPATTARAVALGAVGLAAKTATGSQLVSAIGRAHRDPAPQRSGPRPGPGAALLDSSLGWEVGPTPRESRILAMIADGASNQEIADHCCLSISSVTTYIRTGYRKLGVTRRADAVRWAVEHGPVSRRAVP